MNFLDLLGIEVYESETLKDRSLIFKLPLLVVGLGVAALSPGTSRRKYTNRMARYVFIQSALVYAHYLLPLA